MMRSSQSVETRHDSWRRRSSVAPTARSVITLVRVQALDGGTHLVLLAVDSILSSYSVSIQRTQSDAHDLLVIEPDEHMRLDFALRPMALATIEAILCEMIAGEGPRLPVRVDDAEEP